MLIIVELAELSIPRDIIAFFYGNKTVFCLGTGPREKGLGKVYTIVKVFGRDERFVR